MYMTVHSLGPDQTLHETKQIELIKFMIKSTFDSIKFDKLYLDRPTHSFRQLSRIERVKIESGTNVGLGKLESKVEFKALFKSRSIFPRTYWKRSS